MYYLRTRPAVDAIKFTVDQEALKRGEGGGMAGSVGVAEGVAVGGDVVMEEASIAAKPVMTVTERQEALALACSLENKDACMMCSG